MQVTETPDIRRNVALHFQRLAFTRAIQIANEKLETLITDVYEASCHDEVWSSTVERTKGLDRIVSLAFEKGFCEFEIPLEFTDANGYDFLYCGQKIEHKNATSDGNCWTGNKYGDGSKVPFFLLTRMLLTGKRITGLFAAFVHLDECGPNTRWIETASGKAAFSNLNIAIEDRANVHVVFGDLVKTRGAKRWLKPVLESV